MYEFSPADGFVAISENLGDMIKYIANEPSVGLYYIQLHSQNAVPNVTHLKHSVSDKSREVLLQVEDLEDSIDMVRSMKDCGFPIAEEMIKDMKKSLTIMSSKRPKRGLIGGQQSWSFWAGGSSPGSTWGTPGWSSSSSSSNIRGANTNNRESKTGSGYLTSVFKNAKQTAAEGFKWPQLDLRDLREIRREWGRPVDGGDISAAAAAPPPPPPGLQGSSVGSEQRVEGEGDVGVSTGETGHHMHRAEEEDKSIKLGKVESDTLFSSESKGFDIFKAEKESKLEEWLEGSGGSFDRL